MTHQLRRARYRLAALVAGVLAITVVAIPASASTGSQGTSPVTLRGTLERIVVDPSHEGGGYAAGPPARTPAAAPARADDVVSVVVGHRRIPVHQAQARGIPSGSTVDVTVRGDLAAGETWSPDTMSSESARLADDVMSVEVVASAATGVLGTHHVVVVPIYFDTSSLPAGEPTTTDLANRFAEVDGYYDTDTQAQIRVSVDDVKPWQHVNLGLGTYATCMDEALAIESKVRQITGSTPGDLLHHVVAYYPPSSRCAFAGMATVGASADGDGFIWLNGYSMLAVAGHELGHNFGLYHSGLYECTDGSGHEVTLSADCHQQTYLDPYDIMGNSPFGQVGALSAEHLRQLGVLPASDLTTLTSSTRVTLSRVEGTSGLRGVRFTSGSRTFLVELRTPSGLDSWIDDPAATGSYPPPLGGVVVRVMDSTQADPVEEDILDFHPDGYLRTAPTPGLQSGQWWLDDAKTLGFRVVSMTDAQAVVDVTVPGSPAIGQVTRLSGSNRYATSAAISAASFAPGVDTAYVASGTTFPDALSGAPAAGATPGPVLLTKSDQLPSVIASELDRLDPGRIVVLGGTSSVSSAVASQLAGHTTGPVERWSGPNRYATSATISEQSFDPGVPVAYLASGLSFPDALSGAPAAGSAPGPVLLTRPDQLPSAIAAELARLHPAKIVVLGGTSSVSAQVASQAAAFTTGSVQRWSGPNRYATSATISAKTFDPGIPTVYLASGTKFPDALSGAAPAGAEGSPVLLVKQDDVPTAVRDELDRLDPGQVVILGGTSSVGPEVRNLAAMYAP